ncbi:MAG: signal recognition particle protein [Lachnospiraceae bacterium]|nr:signal recognition particle protein [Lachnospiraceae bacterium]
MAFENLSDKFQAIFRELRSHGRITEDDVRKAMREVRMALLEADVSFKVVKSFVSSVTERAIGQDVMNGLNPGQMVIKIVNEEMIALMGDTVSELQLRPASDMSVILLCGLQGAGKTTMAAKLAGYLRSKGRNPLLAACDVYRPAAIKQLQINGEKLGIPVFAMGENADPVDIAKAAVSHAKENKRNVVILDTAGRLHIDEEMMDELKRIKENVNVTQTVLVIDAMTGQDAVNVAASFNDEIGIDGVILTKLDGDTRGGAALSVKAATGCPILFSGVGEKLTDIEPFYPDRMAGRILGMGDVLSLIEKAEQQVDVDEAKEMAKRMQKGKFDYNNFLSQMQQMRSMGGISAILSSLPGGMGALGGRKGQMPDADATEKQLTKIEAMIHSMTKYERTHPDVINLPRKNRIAKGAGLDIAEVNRIVKQFEQSRKMMKQMTGMMNNRHGRFRLPF